MTASWLVVYRGLLFIAVLFAVGILYFARGQRGKPGFRPLLVLVAGGLIYVATKLAVSFLRGTPPVFLMTRFNPLGAGLAAMGFVLFVLEYIGIEQPVSRRTAALLLGFPVLVNISVWVDLEYLWIPTGRDTSTLSGYAWEFTSLGIANQLYLNLVVIAGLILLIRFGLRSTAPFTHQVSALILAGSAPLIGNFLFHTEYVPFNLAPIMIVFSAFVILWVMARGQLLDLVPISRDTVIDCIGTGVLTVDMDHRVIDINQAARHLFSVDEDEHVIGQHIDEVFRECTAGQEAYWSSTDLDSGETVELEVDDRHFAVEATDLTRADGKVRGRSFLVRDITEQRAKEQELRRKNERLDRFASMVSHDLQNPLHVAQGRLRLARDDVESEHFDAIATAHDRMEQLLDDLLTMARHGDTVQEVETLDLAAIAQAGWDTTNTPEATLALETERMIRADRGQLQQLLENLFRNAVEHAGEDVTVTVGDTEGGFYVVDDGPGIPVGEREEVFDAGYSTADSTGFGLKIVEEIAQTCGWTVRLTDSEAGGARFEISDVTVVE